MTHTDAIVDFALQPVDLPSGVRADAQRLLTDTLAVGAAGAASPMAVRLSTAMSEWGQGGSARVLAGGRMSSGNAAYFNGFAIHCLEWDAVHEPAVVHALSVVTAALLAASDRAGGCNADDVLTALSVGVDIASGLGLSATGPMTFFRPATAGVIGAAAAVGRLDCLSREEMVNALGLAYSFAAGTMQAHVEASAALPLQIGNAARAAINAVDLAKAGLNGPHDPLEGQFGYSSLIEPVDLARYTSMIGKDWQISEVSTKPFPSGRASHGALGALQALHRTDVTRIELHAPPLIHRLVGRPFDAQATMSYNRLCLAFLAPLMLRDGRIDPRCDRTVVPLAENVTVVDDGNSDANALSPQRLIVTLGDGEVIERAIEANPGSPAAPMSPEQAASKYVLCRELAGNADPRIFDDPLSYATEPR